MRGQAISEYMLVAVFLILIVGLFMLRGTQDTELSMGLAGARLGCAEYNAVENGSVYCTSIAYDVNGSNFTLYPKVFDAQGNRVTVLPGGFYSRMISGVAGSILNNRSFSCNNCGDCLIGHYNYCVNATS